MVPVIFAVLFFSTIYVKWREWKNGVGFELQTLWFED
jgi:hypothetical protein